MTRTLARGAALLFGVGVALAAEPAGGPGYVPLGAFEYPDGIAIAGAQAFSAGGIRQALFRDAVVVSMLVPDADRGEFIRLLKSKVLAGYRRRGFPDVEVEVSFDAEKRRFVVSIAEGRRYKTGGVEVRGNEMLSSEEITAHVLQYKGSVWVHGRDVWSGKCLWNQGGAACFDRISLGELVKGVKDLYATRGYHGPAVTVKAVPDPERGVADLLIDVEAEGPRSLITEIEVTGCERDTVQEVIDYLGVESGDLLTTDLFKTLKKKLRRSARFLRATVAHEPLAGPPGGTRLQIGLEEYEDARPLREELTSAEKTMLRARDWLEGFGEGREDLVLSGLPQWSEKTALPLELVFSGTQGLIVSVAGPGAASQEKSLHLVWSTEVLGVIDAARSRKSLGPAPKRTACVELKTEINPDPNAQQRFSMSIALTWVFAAPREAKQEAGFRWTAMELHPVVFVAMLHRPGFRHSLVDGVLTIGSDDGGIRARVDSETGRIFEVAALDEDTGEQWLRMQSASGAFKRKLDGLQESSAAFESVSDKGELWRSVASFLLDTAVSDGNLLTEGTPVERARASRMLSDLASRSVPVLVEAYRLLLEGDDEKGEAFYIPLRADTAGSFTQMIGSVVARLGLEFPAGSWPRVVGREVMFLLGGDSSHVGRDLQHLYWSKEVGPIGYLQVARLLSMFDPRNAAVFAYLGLQRLAVDDFRRDCRLFLEHPVISQVALSTAREFNRGDEEDLQALEACLTPTGRTTLKAVTRFLKGQEGADEAQTLQPLLDTLWVLWLKAEVEIALKSIAFPTPQRPPAGSEKKEADGAAEPGETAPTEAFWSALVDCDTGALGRFHADEVILAAGSELLKPEWGLSAERGRDSVVAGDKLVAAYEALFEKAGKARWAEAMGAIGKEDRTVTRITARDEQVAGTTPGDVVLLVDTGQGDDRFLYVFRKVGGAWRVVIESADY